MRRPSTWRRCARTAPARSTGAASRRCASAALEPLRCAEVRARSPRATTRCWCALRKLAHDPAGLPQARRRSGSKASTCARPAAARRPAGAGGDRRDRLGRRRRLRDLAERRRRRGGACPTPLFGGIERARVAGRRSASCVALAAAPARCAPACRAWCSTGCRTPATSAPSCAAPRRSASRRSRAQGHGGAVVAEGAARRHGRALRAAPGRRLSRPRRSAHSACRCWRPVRTPATRCHRAAAAVAVRLGVRPRRAGRRAQPLLRALCRATAAHPAAGRRGVAQRRRGRGGVPVRVGRASA